MKLTHNFVWQDANNAFDHINFPNGSMLMWGKLLVIVVEWDADRDSCKVLCANHSTNSVGEVTDFKWSTSEFRRMDVPNEPLEKIQEMIVWTERLRVPHRD